MKARISIFVLAFAVSGLAQTASPSGAQPSSQPAASSAPQNAPTAQGSTAGQQNPQPGAAAPAAPAGKRPPQAKTAEELAAYKTASAQTDPAGLEAAANDFSTKYPDSELRILLYKGAMQLYGRSGDPQKTIDAGRKVLSIDPDDPDALLGVSRELASRARDSDLDKDQQLDEAIKMAQKAMQTLDTDIMVDPTIPQERIDAYKADRRSFAYYIVGLAEYKKENYPGSETALRKSLDLYPSDPVTAYQLTLALDKQSKYADALPVVVQVIQLAKDNQQVRDIAKKECARLSQLGQKPKPAECEDAAAPAAPQK